MNGLRVLSASAILVAIAAGCSTSYSTAVANDGGAGNDGAASDDAGATGAADSSTFGDATAPAEDSATENDANPCGAMLATDPMNCGACGHVCNTVAACVSGECEHVVFLLAGPGPTGANLGGLSGADARCQAAAKNATLHNTFFAWLGASTASPSTRFVKGKRPYVLVGGTVVAADFTALTATAITPLAHAILDDASGLPVAGVAKVWSNVTQDGTTASANSCADWTSTMGTTIVGMPSDLDTRWSDYNNDSCGNNGDGLYCFEQ